MPTELGSYSICPDCGAQVLGGLYGSGHSCQASMERLKKELERTRGILFYSRDEQYGWLSNFHRATECVDDCVDDVDGLLKRPYPTNEHYYQSQKAQDHSIGMWIAQAPIPFLAMKAGRSLRSHEIRPDWEAIKFDVMLKGLRAKFSQNLDLKQKLLATGDEPLHENSPTDLIWGMRGKDMLGKLLMKVREELKAVE